MLAKVASCALVGLDGAIIEVEIDISRGLPAFTKDVLEDLPLYPPHSIRCVLSSV